MLTIVQRGGATREKPPEAVRGPASRLPWAWDGLCVAVPFNDSTRDAARDLVSNAAPSAVNGLSWTRDNRGNSAATLADLNYIQYPDSPMHTKPTTAITAYVRFRRVGTFPNAFGGLMVKRYHPTISPYIAWAIQGGEFGDSVSAAVSADTSGSVYAVDSTYVITTTDWISAFMRWRDAAPLRLDILGERGETKDTVIHASAKSGSLAYTTGQPLSFNTGEHDDNNCWADYSQGMVWSRWLTDVEIQALVADPYGWYSPRRETVGVSSPYPLIAPQSFMREVPSG